MYHPEIIKKKVSQQETRFGIQIQRISVADAQARSIYLEAKKGSAIEQADQTHILSELALCKADASYWLERYAKIKTADMRVTAMPLLPAQQVIINKLGEYELRIARKEHEDGIMPIVLKSRQQGATTLFSLLTAHRAFFYGNSLALIASDEEEHSAYVFDMLERVHANLPWWMQPAKTHHEKDYEMFFGQIDSLIRLDWANNKRGAGGEGNLGRGMTPNIFHGSEISSWTESQCDQLDYSLLPGMHMLPTTFGILESTPKGEGNYFHRTWVQSVAKEKRWFPVFVGWYIDPKLKLTPPANWEPGELTRAHAEKVERSSPEWAGWRVTLTRDQMYWWERGYLDAKKNNKSQLFFSEYAADPETCFASSIDSIFPAEAIASLYQTARPLISVVDVVGATRSA